jgi:4-hydroxy-4-methyl-2-oxoglutarate aldolase
MTDEELFGQVDTTAICDADKTTRVLDSGIRLRSANPRIFGPAYTVRCRDDFLGVLRAIEAAEPGDVIVVDGGGTEIALGGELFARGALVRRLGGIVVDAGYRDIGYVEQCALPVYSRYVTPMAGTTGTPGELQTAISCGGVAVHPGDLVLADHEGLIVVEPAKVRGVLEAAAAIKRAEQAVVDRLDNGQTLSDGLNLDEHVAALERGEPSALRFLD